MSAMHSTVSIAIPISQRSRYKYECTCRLERGCSYTRINKSSSAEQALDALPL